ncbi:hypothetical protein A0U94_14535 (plasmid) [Gluconobacter albidus]|nr:hypothetical protein A0U94_14535 [Gluconobacter albidus]OUI80267.1 hypothetical protein HK22_06860 [Gluconobacter sp. DsW_056]
MSASSARPIIVVASAGLVAKRISSGTCAAGGHVAPCGYCGHWRIAYNSCRNRHCPRCQVNAARTWLAEREADLLPVGYFHVVFTLPARISTDARL